MSVHTIYLKDGVKMMRPILTREEYLGLRNGGEQKQLVARIRAGDEGLKSKLVQMNYSCLPNADGSLKGSKKASMSVGMDIDFKAPCDLPEEEKKTWLAACMAKVPEMVMAKKDELGLLMLERSATKGYHLVFRRRPELSQEENLRWASELLGVEYDDKAKDITRVFFTTTGSEEDLIYLDDGIFEVSAAENRGGRAAEGHTQGTGTTVPCEQSTDGVQSPCATEQSPCVTYPTEYHGIPFKDIIAKYWEVNNRGFEPTQGDRDTLTYQLACDLRHICGRSFEWLDQVIPCYDGFPLEEKRQKIRSALASEFNGFPQRLRNVLNALQMSDGRWMMDDVDGSSDVEDEQLSSLNSQLATRKLPQGIKESIDAVGPQLAMPIVTAICPCIGTLATGVTLDVHGQKKGLNLIAYIAGDFASGKGGIDPVVEAWMSEVAALDKMYQMQEDEWRAKKRAAKNKKEQPEEPKLPVRCLTLNNTVANLAERLANTEGKHAFSFTPEADTVAQKWKSTMSDFSVMLRQSYDGTKYEREARSADAVNVHIERLLWNVTMCGTPDALYRVVSNYTDGFQSRIAVARTPDNTFAPLEDKPYVLTDRQRERIQQIAHLLPLMYGEVVLPKLEAKGREWVERIRLETMKNDDRTRARQRFRVCVTAQRMTCCLMLCKVCEGLIQKHGLNGAETKLKQHPNLWKELLLKAQTPAMLEVYDVIADSLLENALYFFRDRIENAFMSREYAGCRSGERKKRGRNDSIFERLDSQFSFEQAMQHSVAVKGAGVNHNTVRQMLKNWRKQSLVFLTDDGRYRKVNSEK
jgi:hypothetical protein